jgi:hypothetical protein
MGLITELVLTCRDPDHIIFETSKRKTIFAMTFLLSGTLLALMWLAARDLFAVMQRTGTWVDHAIVATFYTATLAYPVFAVLFMGYRKRISVERRQGALTTRISFLGVTVRARVTAFSKISRVEIQKILKGKNIAHDHVRLKLWRNEGYWQVVIVESDNQTITIDRHTDRKEMVALALYLEKYTGAHLDGIEDEERINAVSALGKFRDATSLPETRWQPSP